MSPHLKMSSIALALTLSTPIALAETLNGMSPNVAADLLYQLESLQREVSQLRGQVEQQQYELDKMKTLQKDRYIDLDKRISSLASKPPIAPPVSESISAPAAQSTASVPTPAIDVPVAPEAAPVKSSSSASVAVSSQSVSTPPAKPSKIEEASDQAKSAYDSAYDQIKSKNFEGAQTAFRSFVKKYPNNSLTGNAYYWLGELALVLGNQGEALVQFKTVEESFASHQKVPDAIYKLGIVNDQIGNQTLARDYFNRVISSYPNSNAATLATNYLNNMK